MSQIQNGYTWTSGEICTAAHLNQMLNSATLNTESVTGQTLITTVVPADVLMVAQNASGELRSATVADVMATSGVSLNPSGLTNVTGSDLSVVINGTGKKFLVQSFAGNIDLQSSNDFDASAGANVNVLAFTGGYDAAKGDINITGTRITLTAQPALGAPAGESQQITLDGNVTITGKNNIMPTGCVMLFANASVPTGWAKCNGAAVSRTSSTYSDLFLAIGTIYGSGDGVNTFNLPDLRGEFVRGWDDGRGVDTGRAIGSHQDQQLEKHKHIASNNDCQSYSGVNGVGTGTYNTWCDTSGVVTNNLAALTGDGSHTEQTAKLGQETRPRNTAMMYCIKH